MSTRDFSWGKGGRCLCLTNYHPCSVERPADLGGALTYPEPLGPPRPVAGHLYFLVRIAGILPTFTLRPLFRYRFLNPTLIFFGAT